MFLTVIYILKRRDGALPFIIRAKRAGVWARTKDHSRGEIGVDGLEILDILGDNEEEHGGRGRGKRVKEKRMKRLKDKKDGGYIG